MSKTTPTRKRRWLQFSLRSLFVVTTLLAVWIGYHVNRARNQQKAVETVLRLGGTVHYDYQYEEDGSTPPGGVRTDASPPGPEWLRRIVGDEFFRDVVFVHLSESPATDEDLECLRHFPKLDTLRLDNTAIEGRGLQHIRTMRFLKSLSLQHTNVDDASLVYLRNLTELRYLGLGWTRVTGRGLENLKDLQKLDTLWLADTGVTDADVQHITCLQNLVDLNLAGTKIGDEGACQLKELPRLAILWLDRTNIGDGGVAHLRQLHSLAELEICDTGVGDGALADLGDIASRAVHGIGISGTDVTPLGYQELRLAVPDGRIRYNAFDLSLRPGDTPAANAAVRQWVDKLVALSDQGRFFRLISFAGHPLTDQHLDTLAKVRGAEVIDLRQTKVSEAGIEELRKALPGCTIRY